MSRFRFTLSLFVRILSIIFCLLLVINVFRNVFNGGSSIVQVNFTGLLNSLSDYPTISFTNTISNFTITADWGFLNGLRNFINIFMKAVGLIVFLANNLTSMLSFVFRSLAILLGF